MSAFQYKEEEIGCFLQLDSACAEEELAGELTIRYIAAGITTERGFSGVVYGYEGGGEFSEGLAVDGEYISDRSDDDDGLDCREIESVFSTSTSEEFLDACYTMLSLHGKYDDSGMYRMAKVSDLPSDRKSEDVSFTMGAKISPISYGLTSF